MLLKIDHQLVDVKKENYLQNGDTRIREDTSSTKKEPPVRYTRTPSSREQSSGGLTKTVGNASAREFVYSPDSGNTFAYSPILTRGLTKAGGNTTARSWMKGASMDHHTGFYHIIRVISLRAPEMKTTKM